MTKDQTGLFRSPIVLRDDHDSGVDAESRNLNMNDRHRPYFERRMNEERIAAASAPNPVAKLAHLSFAQLYQERLGTVTAQDAPDIDMATADTVEPLPKENAR